MVTMTTTSASLSWYDYNTYSSLVPFDSYTVQMSTSGSSGSWSTLTEITNPSQNTYTTTGLSPGQEYYFMMYDTVGTSGCMQSAYSNVVSNSTVLQLTASISASTATIDVGQQVQFSASASGGTPPYSYQWYSNGNPVAGATSSSFALSPMHACMGQQSLQVKVTDSFGYTVASNTATVVYSYDYLLFGLIASLVVIVLVVILVVLRRRSGKSTPQASVSNMKAQP
jgi:chitodextrinase